MEPTETPVVDKAINVGILRESAIVALLEDYGRFLLKHGKVSSIEECRNKIGVVISAAMDRGDVDANVLSHLERWLSKRTVNTNFTCCAKRTEKYLSHALVEEMGEVMAEKEVLNDPSLAEFKAAYELYTQYKAAVNGLISKYGQEVKAEAGRFVTDFKNLFDPEFVSKIEEASTLGM